MYDFSKITPASSEPYVRSTKHTKKASTKKPGKKRVGDVEDVRSNEHASPSSEKRVGENYVSTDEKGYGVERQNYEENLHENSTPSPSPSIFSSIPEHILQAISPSKYNVRNSGHKKSTNSSIPSTNLISDSNTLGQTQTIDSNIEDIRFEDIQVLPAKSDLYPGKGKKKVEKEIPITDEKFIENFVCENEEVDSSTHNDFTLPGLAGIDLGELDREVIRAKAELCKKDFAYFIREFWDEVVVEKCIWNWHMDLLASQLQPAAFQVANRRRKEEDIIINIPPGTSKSSIISVLFPVYCWLIDPTISFITASHEQDLANRLSNASRQLVKSEKFKSYFPHLSFKETQDNKTDYENRHGGYRVATSTKASPTGRHALVIILDDPQNPDTAYSEIERNNVNTWVGSTLSTRKSNKEVTVMITVQQRLHPNDVTGYLLGTGKKFNHICLPAEVNKFVRPSEAIPFYKEGLLDVIRLNREVLIEMQMEMGSKSYQTQMNQAPNDEENAILKEIWFQKVSKLDFEALMKANKGVIDFFVDTAFTKKTNRDPSAMLSCCKMNNNLFITGVKSVRLEFPKLVKEVIDYTKNKGYTPQSKVWVEGHANGISLIQQLKADTGLNVKQQPDVKMDKIERLHALSSTVETGRVFLVEDHWNSVFLSEVTADDPVHDDIRDCFCAAMENKMIRSQNYGKHVFNII